jgi:hypothetical protein
MGIAQFCVAMGLVNEKQTLGPGLSRKGYEKVLIYFWEVAKRSMCLLFVYICCIFLLRVICDLLGCRVHGRAGIFDFVNASV